MLGKTKSKWRRRWQTKRWLDGTTDSMDMSLSKLGKIVKDRGASHAAVHGGLRVGHELVTKQQQQKDTTPEEWTEADLMEVTASKWVPYDEEEDGEEAVTENNWCVIWENNFDYSRLHLTSYKTWTLLCYRHWNKKQMMKEGLVPYRNSFREMKKQKSQTAIKCISVKLHWVCLPLWPPLPPLLSFPSLPPLRQQDQPLIFLLLSLFNMETTKMKTFIVIHFRIMNSIPCHTVNKFICCAHVHLCKNLITIHFHVIMIT